MPRTILPAHHHRSGATAIRRSIAILAAGLLSACAVGVSAEPIAAKSMDVTPDVTRRIERDLAAFFDFEDARAAAHGQPVQRAELVTLCVRARARHPVVLRLLDAGKIGETWEGELDPVRAGDIDDLLDPAAPDGGTIQGLLEDENGARLQVYECIARGQPVSAADVGICNAAREFAQAAPDHYLRPKGCDWTRHKDLHPEASVAPPAGEPARRP